MKFLAQFYSYLKYLFFSKDEHSIQAPFLFGVYTNCFIRKNASLPIENLRNELLKNTTLLNLNGFGTAKKSRLKSIKKIAQTSISPAKYCQLQQNIVKYLDCKTIIELGTSLGIQTAYFSCENDASRRIITIEGENSICEIAKKNWLKLGIHNIEIVNGDFDDVFLKTLQRAKIFDYLYIDGNHSYEATIRYFNQAITFANENAVIVFDDINWSEEMQMAWKEIKYSKEISVSIDIFRLGIVFLSKKLSKQDFLLRF